MECGANYERTTFDLGPPEEGFRILPTFSPPAPREIPRAPKKASPELPIAQTRAAIFPYVLAFGHLKKYLRSPGLQPGFSFLGELSGPCDRLLPRDKHCLPSRAVRYETPACSQSLPAKPD